MKKITFKLLFCLLLSQFTNAQNPVANDDYFQACPFEYNNFFPLQNDYAYNGNTIEYSSLDLNPALAGIQSTVIINGIEFNTNGFGYVTSNYIYPGGYFQIPYTFTDTFGNVSNIGNIGINVVSYSLRSDVFYSSSGTTTQSVLANDFGYYYGGDFPNFNNTYDGFTMQPDGTIVINATVAPGVYTMDYHIGDCYANSTTITLYVTELDLNVVGTYTDYNADGFVSLGDVINYDINLSNLSNTNNLNNVTVTSSETNVNGAVIPVLAPNTSNSTSYSGNYVLTQNDINFGQIWEKTINATATSTAGTSIIEKHTTTYLNTNDGIKLNAFFDANTNGMQEWNEVSLNFGQFLVEANNDGIIHNFTSSNGIKYLYIINPSTSYDLSYVLDAAYSSYYTLSTPSYSNVSVATGSGIITYNFPLVASASYNDLSVNVLPSGAPPRPGFTYNNKIKFTNNSNQTISNGTVSFNCGSNVSILSTLPTANTMSATNFTYNFTNLLPFESRYVDVNMQVPVIPTVTLGDLVTNSATIIPNAGDITPLNNSSSLTQTIVGSYDPNDKVESHGEQILHSSFTSNDYLTYTIRFENTGTANAVSVRVNDVLDAQLDETSIKVIDASHAYVLDRVGTNLNFKFDGIDLPPSVADTSIGKGYVVFQVKPKPGYAVGDIIPNTANIYFDFNPAIVTNTFLTEFVSILNVDSFLTDQTVIYPNPTSNVLNIESKNKISNIEIIDINGRSLLSKSLNSNSTSINVESLSNGIYFVKVWNENGNFVQKFTKK
jgi:uncharacterized repeat protein (TIGR01451 family)